MSRPQVQSQSEAQPQGSKAPSKATIVVRVIILVSLLVSLIIIVSNTATLKGEYRDVTVRFKHIYAYRFMLSTIVLGMSYVLLQIPFPIYHVCVGKPPVQHEGLLQFDFYGDKVLLALLATGVGAAFGATVDLKKNLDELDDALQQYYSSASLNQIRSTLDNFFNMASLSTGFLLIAFFGSIASSILSSLALIPKKPQEGVELRNQA